MGERSIDLLLDLLGRFARCVPAPEALADALIARLAVHRKKASQSLALLATAMTAAQLGGLLGALLEGASAPAQWRLQALGGVSKLVGWRFAPYAAPTVLLARGVLGATSDEGQEEVQEQCLQALEAVVAHCPAESRAVAADILESALTYVRHDPNYQWESEEEEGDEGGAAAGGSDDGAGMGSDEEEALSEEEYSDDEDLSWKVRSAAARLLRAAVEHRLVPLERLYEAVGGPLVARLREREPVVLLEVYGAYGALLGVLRGAPAALAPVAADAPRVVRSLDRQLAAPGPKAAKAGAEAYALLLQLLTALPVPTAALLPRAFASIRNTLADASASVPTLKLVALQLLQRYLGLVAAADRAPDGLADMLRAVVRCAGEPYYRTAAESLRALEAAAPLALLGLGPAAPSPPLLPDAAVATLARLALSGEDQEVKEAATLAAAALLAHHGAELAQVGADATASIGALAQKFAAMPHAPKRAKLSGGEDEAQQQQLGGPITNEASRGGGRFLWEGGGLGCSACIMCPCLKP